MDVIDLNLCEMLTIKNVILGLGALLILSSCSPNLSPYTQDLHRSLNLSDAEMKKVQFYLSEELVLERISDLDQAEIKEGRITLSRDRDVKRVRIPARTPGVLVSSPDGERLAVSFDPESEREYLTFGPSSGMQGRYMLTAREWQGRSAIVTYGGLPYRTQPGAQSVGLLVELRALEKQRTESRTVRGRKP